MKLELFIEMTSWKSSEKSIHEYMRPKQSLQRLESSISKCTNVVIPLHLDLLRKHAANIQKYQQLKEWSKVRQEQINATRTVEQLKADLWSLDLLRNQIVDDDMVEFNKRAEKSQADVSDTIEMFLDVVNKMNANETPSHDADVVQNDDQLSLSSSNQKLEQAFAPIESEQALRDSVHQQSSVAASWEELADNLEDLNKTLVILSSLVHSQQESVNRIENNIESADKEVLAGTKNLAIARKYKTVIYPVAGAIVGGCIGGPVGLFVGLKAGAAAVALGGLIGFTSGRMFKRKVDKTVEMEMHYLDQMRMDYSTSLKSSSMPDMRVVCYENPEGFMNVSKIQKT